MQITALRTESFGQDDGVLKGADIVHCSLFVNYVDEPNNADAADPFHSHFHWAFLQPHGYADVMDVTRKPALYQQAFDDQIQ